MIAQSVGYIQQFYNQNPNLDLLNHDFIKKPGTERSEFNWDEIPEDMQGKVQRQILAFQRVRNLASDTQNSDVLLEKGLDSAYKIAYAGRHSFQSKTNLEAKIAGQIFARAQRAAAKATNRYYSIIELHHNQRFGLRVDNTIPQQHTGYKVNTPNFNPKNPASGSTNGSTNGTSNGNGNGYEDDSPVALKINESLYEQVRNELLDIDGFETLFGPQNFCQCDHCKSIFSPAAYFVDLMQFVERHISRYSIDNYATDHPNLRIDTYPLHLENRRPDLWDMELTCDNTYEMVPYLQIVNEIKEAYIKKLWQVDTAAGHQTNQLDDVYESIWTVPENRIFFYSPPFAAFEEVTILLDYFKTSLHEVQTGSIGTGGIYEWVSYLELPRWQIFNIQDPFKFFGNQGVFDSMYVKDFLKHTKISRGQLDELIASEFVGSRGNMKIIKEVFDPGIQYEFEKIIDIEEEQLRYLVFFLRVWKKLDLSIPEFDLAYSVIIKQYNPGSNVGPYWAPQVLGLVKLLKIQRYLGISLEEVVGIVDIIPNKSLKTVERKNPLTQELFKEKITIAI
ncbi:MAG: Tc toxin subunit A [Bacteroidia bacterium]